MSEATTVVESSRVSKSKNGSADASRLDEILKEAELGLTKLREFVEAAKTAAGTTAESQAQIATVAIDAQAKLAEITNVATEATTARTKITDSQTVIAAKSDHIEDARVHADKVRADLDAKLTDATKHATESEASKTRAQTAADSASTILAEITTTKSSAQAEADAAVQARNTAEESAQGAKALADKSATVEERVAGYEKRLGELETECANRLKTIDDLLPGATSAGLAYSLDQRRKVFLEPQKRWQWLFVISVLALVFLAASGLVHFYLLGAKPSYEDILHLTLVRVPVAGALVWLALHAGREAALAKRLEEDYGYKSAIASSFEGFRRQMAAIEAQPDSPLGKLCSDTLLTMAAPPGRIYDKHELTVSLAKELKHYAEAVAEAAKPIVDAAKTLTPLQ